MKLLKKIKSWRERNNGAEKRKVSETAKKKLEQVIEQPIVRELFQSDDDLGYC